MAEDLVSGTWTASPILAPANAPDYTFSRLYGISCFSAGNCVAVGEYVISTVNTEGFYVVESGGSWSTRGVVLPVPADAGTNPALSAFLSVSCQKGGVTCSLLGEYQTNSVPDVVHSVVDTYHSGSGITGSPVEISQLSGQNGIELASISCPAATTCVAVGAQSSAALTEEATYVSENAGVWGVPTVLSNPGSPAFPAEFLSSVSCVAVGDCVAAGDWLNKGGSAFGETYTEQAGLWGSAVDIGQPTSLNNPFVDDISCVSNVTTCTLVGSLSDGQGALHAATAQMTAGHWGQLAPAAVPAGAIPDHEFYSVSCNAGVECTSVGYYNLNTTTGGSEAMSSTWVVGGPPGSVSNLHAIATTTTSIQLQWGAPLNVGTGIDHYEVTTTAGNVSLDRGPAIGTSAVLSKLLPGTTYKINVYTVATDGQTSAPMTISVTTKATIPSAPKITRVVGLHHGLRIVWAAPKTTGGAPITSYRATASCGGLVRTARFGGSARSGSILGLSVHRTCQVRLFAVNRVGSSPSSPPVGGVPRT